MNSYKKIVQWSDEDGCFVGRCPGLFFGGVHGLNEAKVARELDQEVKFWERRRSRGSKRARYNKAPRAYSARRKTG